MLTETIEQNKLDLKLSVTMDFEDFREILDLNQNRLNNYVYVLVEKSSSFPADFLLLRQ